MCIRTVLLEEVHFVSPQNYESWVTLLEVAGARNHSPSLDIAKQLEDNEISKIFHHRKCRSLFTMKKDLDCLCLVVKR